MSAVTNILTSFKHGAITQAQAAAEIEELIELERLQLRDEFAGKALITCAAYATADIETWNADDFAKHAYLVADAMLKARAATCAKSQTLAHYGEQARLAAREGGAK
ncbi:hypothetical protein DBR37_01725 [Herminiimonas sp. KBW02]|uniref:hypothetical protein n=1 Tax=Herminiimonas sp. KBW02 TaxID=2153363 RepID=UPI000F5AAABB|nr:hypothetical protein [Herminiimonas sp. KBW02]RQO38638.1 hypothetical protein DBR37_01725 [Herminiimonas sp. KBW02]